MRWTVRKKRNLHVHTTKIKDRGVCMATVCHTYNMPVPISNQLYGHHSKPSKTSQLIDIDTHTHTHTHTHKMKGGGTGARI